MATTHTKAPNPPTTPFTTYYSSHLAPASVPNPHTGPREDKHKNKYQHVETPFFQASYTQNMAPLAASSSPPQEQQPALDKVCMCMSLMLVAQL